MILISLATVMLSISLCSPQLLNDGNSFLKNFVGADFLATLGFILAITLASAASLHLELNKIEDETGNSFRRTRSSIRRSAYSLTVIFAAAVVLVIVKPLLPAAPFGGVNSAVASSLAILFLYFNLSVLYNLTCTVFKIPSVSAIKRNASDNPEEDNERN